MEPALKTGCSAFPCRL